MNSADRREAASLDDARKALDLIAQYRSPADARAFAVWQAYVRGADAALKTAVDEFLARKQSLNHDDIDFIHRSFIETQERSQDENALCAALIKEVDRILEAVELATGSAARYSRSLKQMSSRLASDIDVGSLQQMIRNLSEITRQTIADNEAMSLNLQAMRAELDAMREALAVVKAQSLTDDLTTLANRRHFDSMIGALLNGVRARREKLGLLMIDIDHFKRFNDLHGHQTGDKVLRLVASTVKKHVPPSAIAARYGGEEMAILLPDHELFQIVRIAESIRTELRGRDLIMRNSGVNLGRVTISAGVAIAAARDTAASLIGRADRCLIAAKAAGRDRTVTEEEIEDAPPQRKAG